MLSIFKKKSKKEVLQKQYNKLMKEAHSLSTSNRRASEEKMVEADRLIQEIEKLANNE